MHLDVVLDAKPEVEVGVIVNSQSQHVALVAPVAGEESGIVEGPLRGATEIAVVEVRAFDRPDGDERDRIHSATPTVMKAATTAHVPRTMAIASRTS